MPTVLVVDDSALDRRLVGGLLEKDGRWTVQYAKHGAEAMALIEQAFPDVVVTDMIMPEMNGLELVTAVRNAYPTVPVILMTSKGNDEIAVQALRRGAASYVPKRKLAEDLTESIHRVLAVSGERRDQKRLVECIANSECSFVLKNDASLIPPLVGYLQEGVTQIGLVDQNEWVRVGIALEEALTNALLHGNLEISSELREEDSKAFEALVAKRKEESPYCNRSIHVCANLSRDKGVFVVRDEGPGFDPSTLPDPTDPANLEKVSGRGVLLMRSFMDDVVYNDQGNEVTLSKRRSDS